MKMLNYENRAKGKYVNESMPELITSQKAYELHALIEIYKARKPKYVLEIGTQEGGTLYHWIKNAIPGAVICNIDILENQSPARHSMLLNRWHGWKSPDVELFTHIGHSQDPPAMDFVKKHLPQIDFLFIDGNHRYQGVKKDWQNYGSMLVSNSVAAFHDIITPTSGFQDHITVCKLWDEIQHVGYITQEIFAEERSDWGGIGVVYVL